MRIEQVDLKAFGHFTDRRLRFDDGAGLHIAYGPNEAGKSTLSRALRAALFGIPERTTDNHVHANANLRIGVVLTASDGRRLAVMRRKARKNSLVRYDPVSGDELGEAVADELLSGWLSGLSEGLYTSMFGLDHDTLVAGGRELAEGKGELGQILFEAGAGLTSIRSLRECLAKEAGELFRPRASTSSIYRTLDQYHEARKEAKLHLTRPAEWDTLRKAAEKAEAEYKAARDQQDRRQGEALRLQRLAAVLPDVAARGLALERLAELREVVRLPPDAANRHIAAQARMTDAAYALQEAENAIQDLNRDLEGIEIPAGVLDEEGAIETLHYRMDAYRAARDQASTARDRQQRADAKVAELTAAIGAAELANPRTLIPDAVIKAGVRSLGSEDTQRRGELKAARAQADQAQQELNDLADELAELGPRQVPDTLLRVLQRLDAEGNPEAKGDELRKQVLSLEDALKREAAALFEGPMEALAALKPPLPSELSGFRKRREALGTSRQSLMGTLESLENDSANVNGEVEGLLQQAEVPTAEQLAQRRAERDVLWLSLRNHLFHESPRPSEQSPTAAEYEAAVQLADSIADRRFADAARVTQHAELMKRLSQMQLRMELERGRLARTETELEQLDQEWQSLLVSQGLPALGMNEFEDWLGRWKLFDQRYVAYLEQQHDLTQASACAASARESLSTALVAAGQAPMDHRESMAQAIARARVFATEAKQAAGKETLLLKKQKTVSQKLQEAQARIEECRAQREAWQGRWAGTMVALRLAGDCGGAEAEARLGQLEALQEQLDLRDSTAAELRAAEAIITQTEGEATRVCAAIGHQTEGKLADTLVQLLWSRLEEALSLATRSGTLQERLRETQKAAEKARQSKGAAERELSELMAAAGCDTLEALIEAEQRSSDYQKLEKDIAETEARLVKASALPLQTVLEQAEGQDLLEVHAALTRQTQEIQQQAPVVEGLHENLIQAQAALGRVDGAAAAAAAEQQAAEAAAALSHQVALFASTRLASALLSDVIETYQQRHQGPLLARASELFATITGGRFVKVVTDFDDERTILVGVRGNGRRELVANLSTGTRDQLFLALRLAAIESHVAGQEPMPVTVDDIVINFDDDSASATFKVLEELSRKTQVLFFTHHEHLLDKASAAIGTDSFKEHRL